MNRNRIDHLQCQQKSPPGYSRRSPLLSNTSLPLAREVITGRGGKLSEGRMGRCKMNPEPTRISQLRQSSPIIMLNMMRVLEQNVGNVLQRPVLVLSNQLRSTSFAVCCQSEQSTHLLALACEDIKLEIGHQEPTGREHPFRSLVVLSRQRRSISSPES
jgi:hypothetical protein